MFEKEWDQKIHLYNRPGMIHGGSHHRRPLALTSKPYHSRDYRHEATTVPHKERKKEKYSCHQEHFDSEDNNYDQHFNGKPKGLRTSRLDAGHHHRPKAPGVGHRSKPPKNVNFSNDIDVPVRKQPHHYSKHAQESGHHSTKKSATNQFD